MVDSAAAGVLRMNRAGLGCKEVEPRPTRRGWPRIANAGVGSVSEVRGSLTRVWRVIIRLECEFAYECALLLGVCVN